MNSRFLDRTLGLLRMTKIVDSSSYLRNSYLSRRYTSEQQSSSAGELALKEKLQQNFPNAQTIHVEDISGGCGSMYQISVTSPDFKGLNTVKQHQLITKALKEEIKNMHGCRIFTNVPDSKN